MSRQNNQEKNIKSMGEKRRHDYDPKKAHSISHLRVVQVRLEKFPQIRRWLAKSNVEKAHAAEVWGIFVVEEAVQLFTGQFDREQFEQEAKRGRNNSSRPDTSDLNRKKNESIYVTYQFRGENIF